MVDGLSLEIKSDLNRLEAYLKKSQVFDVDSILSRCGAQGVSALKSSTPVSTGKTANSWSYEIKKKPGSVKLEWRNSNINEGTSIAIILQYGHGTRAGGYVQGRDYINPAMRPVFDDMVEELKKAVKVR